MYDILLIHPTIPDQHGATGYIPLGMMKVGAYYESQGKKVAYWDGRCDQWWDLIKLAKDSHDIGISAMDGLQYIYAIDIVKWLTIWTNHRGFVFGGYTAQNKKVASKSIVINMKNHQRLSVIRFEKDRYDLQNPITESTKRFYKIFQPQIFTSYGCPHGCTFCSVKGKWISESWQQIEKEVRFIKECGHTFITVNDPNIVGTDPKRIQAIGNIMRKYGMKWHCNIRAGAFDLTGNLLKSLEEGGCISIEIGAESASERLLNLINKGKWYYTKLCIAQHQLMYSRISCMYSFIVGLPTETKHDILQTMKFIDDVHYCDKKARFSMYSYVPYPSKLADQFPDYPKHNYDMAWHPLYFICGLKFRKDNLRKNFPGWKRLIALPFELFAELSWKIRNIYWFPKKVFEWILKIVKQ